MELVSSEPQIPIEHVRRTMNRQKSVKVYPLAGQDWLPAIVATATGWAKECGKPWRRPSCDNDHNFTDLQSRCPKTFGPRRPLADGTRVGEP